MSKSNAYTFLKPSSWYFSPKEFQLLKEFVLFIEFFCVFGVTLWKQFALKNLVSICGIFCSIFWELPKKALFPWFL